MRLAHAFIQLKSKQTYDRKAAIVTKDDNNFIPIIIILFPFT